MYPCTVSHLVVIVLYSNLLYFDTYKVSGVLYIYEISSKTDRFLCITKRVIFIFFGKSIMQSVYCAGVLAGN